MAVLKALTFLTLLILGSTWNPCYDRQVQSSGPPGLGEIIEQPLKDIASSFNQLISSSEREKSYLIANERLKADLVDAQEKLEELRQVIDSLHGKISVLSAHLQELDSKNTGTWTSLPMTDVGSSNLRSPSTMSYVIPNVIPTTAKNVLIYVTAHTGYANNGPLQHIKISTDRNGSDKHYEKYLYLHSYPQDAINTISDNMWFPMPANRRIYMTVTSDAGSNCLAQLYVIGYN